MTAPLITKGSGDTARACREWAADGDERGAVLLVHGLGEHGGRYGHVGEWLASRGYNVSTFDLPGFGASGGHRAYATDFALYLDAIQEEFEALPATEGPKVIYGHSLGGLLSLIYALSDRPQPDRLVLSAPAVGAEVPGWQRASAPFLARILPKLAIPNPIKGEQLSSDPTVGEKYFADPLVYQKATAALGALLFAEMESVQQRLAELTVPTYVLHGSDDSLVPPAVSAPLAELPSVTRRLWPGLRHESHNEPAWEDVLGEVVDWIQS